jgi:hypothetical protein
VFLDPAEGAIQRQLRHVERLDRLDVQSCHAGIKARGSGNEKRGERFLPPRPAGYFTFSTTSISMGSWQARTQGRVVLLGGFDGCLK